MNTISKTVGKLKTNQLEKNSLKNITGLGISSKEINDRVTSTKLNLREILNTGNLIPIEVAQEAIQTSNKVDRLLSMSKDEQIAEQNTIDLAKQFKPYGEKALNILKGVNPFPNVRPSIADDYNTTIAV